MFDVARSLVFNLVTSLQYIHFAEKFNAHCYCAMVRIKLITSCTITVCSHLCSSVKVTSDGMDSLVALSLGDMRRALNILQSTSMAHDEVSEKTVYLCTGQPLPSDIAQIVEWMLNLDFSTAYNSERMVIYLYKIVEGVMGVCTVADLHMQKC